MAVEVSPEASQQDQFDPPMSGDQWLDEAWKANEDVLPANVCARLRNLDQALFGINTLTAMLMRDADMQASAKAEGFDYTPIPSHERWGLGHALAVLVRESIDSMEGLRDRDWIQPSEAGRDVDA